jgi:hypothetical protein
MISIVNIGIFLVIVIVVVISINLSSHKVKPELDQTNTTSVNTQQRNVKQELDTNIIQTTTNIQQRNVKQELDTNIIQTTTNIQQRNIKPELDTNIIQTTSVNISKPPRAKNPNILFDESSFERFFYTTDYTYGFQGDNMGDIMVRRNKTPQRLDQRYIDALKIAARRWNNLIKYSNEMIDFIQNIPNRDTWSGIELVGVGIKSTQIVGVTDRYADAMSFEITDFNTNGIHIMSMNRTLNLKMILTIYEYNLINTLNNDPLHISNVFTHELGHVLGMPIWPTSIPNDISFYYNANNGRTFYSNTNLPLTSNEYNKLQRDAINNYNDWKGTSIPNNIELSLIPLNLTCTDLTCNNLPREYFSNNHWTSDTITSNGNTYFGLVNEIMCPVYRYLNISTHPYLISKLTIKQLIEIYTHNNGTNIYNYVEISPDNSEVSYSLPVESTIGTTKVMKIVFYNR